MFIVGDLCQVFPMKTGFTKCHFCGRIASTCVGRSVYSTLIWRALRAQMSNFNFRLASSSGPRCPISTCVWRALSGPRYSMCFNLHLASSLRAQISKSNFRLASSFQGPDVRCVSTFVWRAPPGPRLIDLRRTRKRKSADGGRAEVDYFLLGVQRPSATPALVATPKESKVSLVVVEWSKIMNHKILLERSFISNLIFMILNFRLRDVCGCGVWRRKKTGGRRLESLFHLEVRGAAGLGEDAERFGELFRARRIGGRSYPSAWLNRVDLVHRQSFIFNPRRGSRVSLDSGCRRRNVSTLSSTQKFSRSGELPRAQTDVMTPKILSHSSRMNPRGRNSPMAHVISNAKRLLRILADSTSRVWRLAPPWRRWMPRWLKRGEGEWEKKPDSTHFSSLKRANLVTTSEDKPERGVISTAGSSSTVFGLLLFCECGFPPGSPVSTLITIQSIQLESRRSWSQLQFSWKKRCGFSPGQLRFPPKLNFLNFFLLQKMWFFPRANSGFPPSRLFFKHNFLK